MINSRGNEMENFNWSNLSLPPPTQKGTVVQEFPRSFAKRKPACSFPLFAACRKHINGCMTHQANRVEKRGKRAPVWSKFWGLASRPINQRKRERESFRKAKQVVSLLCRWPVPVSRTKILRLLLDDSATTNEKDERQITKIGKPKISTKF